MVPVVSAEIDGKDTDKSAEENRILYIIFIGLSFLVY